MSQAIPIPELRSLIGPYTEWASNRVHGRFPGLEADHLSFAGAVLVAAGSAAAASSIKYSSTVSLPLNVVGAATDAFNGALAKVCYGDDPDRLERGNKVDSMSDFVKDLSMGMAKIAVTSHRDGRLSRPLAELATLTTPLASFSRSYMEKQGYKINEHGNSWLEFIGTRAARTALNAVSASNVRIRGIPLQPYLDALITVGNLTRITKNLTASSEQPSLLMNKKAQFRTKFHLTSAVISGAGILAARKLLN